MSAATRFRAYVPMMLCALLRRAPETAFAQRRLLVRDMVLMKIVVRGTNMRSIISSDTSELLALDPTTGTEHSAPIL